MRSVGPLLHSFIYGGGGHPIDTQVDFLAVCGAPSTDFHLGHIVVVLRRSPASVTSSSPSTRRRADETLPRPQLDLEFEGHHQVERVQIAEVSCIRYLIGWIAKTFDYINRVIQCFRFRSTRVRRHTLPSRCYASLDRSCVFVGFFLKYCVP